MKLASYTSNRKGFKGLFSKLIRKRFKGKYSHNEVIFEPSDGVDHLMPDGTTEPDANGAVWCGSADGMDRIPNHSTYRAGKRGGVRLKRIVIDDTKWDIIPYKKNPIHAAIWFVVHQGKAYDWRLIGGFTGVIMSILMEHSKDKVVCSEACMACSGFKEAHRVDPCLAHEIVNSYND